MNFLKLKFRVSVSIIIDVLISCVLLVSSRFNIGLYSVSNIIITLVVEMEDRIKYLIIGIIIGIVIGVAVFYLLVHFRLLNLGFGSFRRFGNSTNFPGNSNPPT